MGDKMSMVDLGKRLLDAAKHGYTDEVRTLMSNGAPFTTDWLGTSPLHFSCMNGHLATSEVLLRAGISRDARTKVDRTPLHVAAQEGHFEIVDLLVRNGADVDAKDMLKMTPLHWAVERQHIEVIQYLLRHGAEINTQNKFEKSPVDIAITKCRGDIAHMLQQSVVEVTSTAEDHPYMGEVTEVGEAEAETIAATESVAVDNEGVTTPVAFINTSAGGAVTSKRESTEVLATLAALAEVTANTGASDSSPTAQTTADADTLKWLESQGITMISTDNTTIVGNTVENGQQLALTEAGKLALNEIVKQKREISVTDPGMVIASTDGIDASIAPMVVTYTTADGTAHITEEDDEPSLKRIKLEKDIGLEVEADQDEEDVGLGEGIHIKLEGHVEEEIGVQEVPVEYVSEVAHEYEHDDADEYVNEELTVGEVEES